VEAIGLRGLGGTDRHRLVVSLVLTEVHVLGLRYKVLPEARALDLPVQRTGCAVHKVGWGV
jgi:hypothetical protein